MANVFGLVISNHVQVCVLAVICGGKISVVAKRIQNYEISAFSSTQQRYCTFRRLFVIIMWQVVSDVSTSDFYCHRSVDFAVKLSAVLFMNDFRAGMLSFAAH